MYRLLLCWRYLRTRYIALASIVSVMLGRGHDDRGQRVMSGFTSEMQNRIHGILSDVVLESRSLDGFPDADWHMDRIRQAAGDVDPGDDAHGGRAGDALLPRGRQQDHPAGAAHRHRREDPGRGERFRQVPPAPAEPPARPSELRSSPGRVRRRRPSAQQRRQAAGADGRGRLEAPRPHGRNGGVPQEALPRPASRPENRPQRRSRTPSASVQSATLLPQSRSFDPKKQQHAGLIMGIALASFRTGDGVDHFMALPGDDVKLTVPARPGHGHAHRTGRDRRRLHGRRLLREQDERVRFELRLRAHPRAAKTPRHDRSRPPAWAWSTRSRSSSSPAPTATRSATSSAPPSSRSSTP